MMLSVGDVYWIAAGCALIGFLLGWIIRSPFLAELREEALQYRALILEVFKRAFDLDTGSTGSTGSTDEDSEG